MNTKYKNATDAAAALGGDPKLKEEVQIEISKSDIVTTLLEGRLAKGLTQEEIAKSMGCHPSKISRIESGTDNELKWRDILAYLSALNLGMTLCFDDPSLPAASRIKAYVFSIHRDLEELVKLAKQVGDGDQITKEINVFFGQVLFNFFTRFEESHKKLAPIKVPAPKPSPAEPKVDSDSVSSSAADDSLAKVG